MLFTPQSWRPARTTSRKVSVTSRSTPAELTLKKPTTKIDQSRSYLPHVAFHCLIANVVRERETLRLKQIEMEKEGKKKPL